MGSDVKKAFGAKRDELLWFEPEQLTLVTDPKHPLYDERIHLPLQENLVRNIMVKGVLKAILVRRNGEEDGKPIVEVVDGRQRVRHALEANKRLKKEGKALVRVPAMRKRGEDGDIFGMMVSANEFNQADDVVTKAKKLQRFLDFNGGSKEEAAVVFGVTAQTIRNLLAVLECAPPVLRALAQGEIPATVVRDFAKMSRDKQVLALAAMRKQGVTKGAVAKVAARASRQDRALPSKDGGGRLRSRTFLLNWKAAADDAGEKSLAAILGFVLGDDNAISGYSGLVKLAELAKG